MTSKKVREFIRAHVLGFMAIFIALTGTAVAGQSSGGDGPTASASVTNTQFKKLKKRVAALEAKPAPAIPTTLPPSGPAGGSLTGNYPNPLIGNNTVGTPELVDGSVTNQKLAANSVGSGNVIDGSLGGVDLKNTFSTASGGSTVAANTYTTQTADCSGNRLLGGGFAWASGDTATPATSVETATNAPAGAAGDNPTAWTVVSRSSTNNDTLFAWAVCLRV
jgi:hypothetical protein